MKLIQALFAAMACSFPLLAVEPAGLITHSVSIPNHGVLKVAVPKAWSFSAPTPAGDEFPRMIRIQSANGDVSIQFTVFWDGFGPRQLKPTDVELAEMLKSTAETQYAQASVEKKVIVEKLKGRATTGSFARFTDSNWVGQQPPAGEFSNVAVGMIRCGDLWGNFTLLTNEKDGPNFKRGLAVIEALRQTNVRINAANPRVPSPQA